MMGRMARPTRPTGQPTRGKTAENRLRQVDVYVALAHACTLRGGEPLCVDLGYGERPTTALEMAERFARVNPAVRVLGVEIDSGRVLAARAFADPPRVDFALGGFNLIAVLGGQRARYVRAYNVLRQYDEEHVSAALAQVAAGVEPGGIVVEGTSNPTGAIVAFDVWRRDPAADNALGLTHVSLVFGSNFREVHEPADYQTILPKRLIHRMLDPEPGRFFEDWKRAASVARGRAAAGGPREQWVATGDVLREMGWPLDARKRISQRGFLALATDLR